RGGKAAWPDYEAALVAARAVVVPALVLAEVDYLLRDHRAVMRKLAAELFDPATTYEYELTLPEDIVRALQIDRQFAALKAGLVDGVVAAVAERRGILRVLTTDRRDFSAIRVGRNYERALTLLPR